MVHLNLQTAARAVWQLEAVIYTPSAGVIYSNWADIVQSGKEPTASSQAESPSTAPLAPGGPANLR